jgi:hypothetical protein
VEVAAELEGLLTDAFHDVAADARLEEADFFVSSEDKRMQRINTILILALIFQPISTSNGQSHP